MRHLGPPSDIRAPGRPPSTDPTRADHSCPRSPTLGGMVRDPVELLGEAGWITGPELLEAVSRSTVQRWVSTGALVRLAPALFRPAVVRSGLACAGRHGGARTGRDRQSCDLAGPLGSGRAPAGAGARHGVPRLERARLAGGGGAPNSDAAHEHARRRAAQHPAGPRDRRELGHDDACGSGRDTGRRHHRRPTPPLHAAGALP